MKEWTKKEKDYLIKNYSNKLNKDISNSLKRKIGSILYMAHKLNLKKDKIFFEISRKRTSIVFKKEDLKKLYFQDKKSIREISKQLGVNKSTIEHYFKKFNLKRRTQREALKLSSKKSNWIRGLNKNDTRVKLLSLSIKKAYQKKREQRIKEIERKFGKKIKQIIIDLYWYKKLNQEQVARKIGYDKKIVIELMKKYNIKKRPKYSYISSLKGKNHSQSGKKWEEFMGKENAEKRKKLSSKRFKNLTLRRLENNEFPFFDTRIEKRMAEELLKRNILFVKQFRLGNKFSCDFAIPYIKVIIECDGDYWHANPKLYNRSNLEKLNKIQRKNLNRDKYKDHFLSKQGWLVLRFFETDINSNISSCVDKVEEVIKQRIEQLKKIKSPIDSL